LKCSCDKIWTVKNILIVQANHFIILWITWIRVKLWVWMILCTASCKEITKMSTVIHYEEIDRNNYTPTCHVDIIRVSSAFCKCHFGLCLNFHRVLFRAWIFSTSTEQRLDLRHSRNSLPVHWNGMLRNSRSHLAVQHPPPLNWIRCWWVWTQWKLEPKQYADSTDADDWRFDGDL
jgi:hypothetical protein